MEIDVRTYLDNLQTRLTEHRSIAPLAVFRIILGLCVSVSTLRFLLKGWVYEQYIAPKVHFSYYGFEWVKGVEYIGSDGVYGLFILLLVSSLCVLFGAWYRTTSVVMFCTFTYIELLDVTYYLNHYYFVSIIAAMMMVLPAHRSCSWDVKRGNTSELTHIPSWIIFALQGQIALVYIYAGLAKIQSDWLMQALPLSLWLPAHDQLPFIGEYFRQRWLAYVFSWCGMFFDCTIPFFLLWKKTRVFAYLAVVLFHTITGWMFPIGVFPLVMSLAVIVFFSEKFHLTITTWLHQHIVCRTDEAASTKQSWYRPSIILQSIFVIHILFQLLFPWRFMMYPGSMFWTEQGYRFGWRVMLMEKAGSATFFVRDSLTNRQGVVDNREFLNEHQEKQMAMQPDMILQYAHYLQTEFARKGMSNPSVRAEVWVTLNARPSTLLFSPKLELTTLDDSWEHKWWLLPMNK